MNDMLDAWMRPPRGVSRSASPENVTGAPGMGGMADPACPTQPGLREFGQVPDLEQPNPGRDLGPKHKNRAWIWLDPGVETPILDTDGPGIGCPFGPLRRKSTAGVSSCGSTGTAKTPQRQIPLGDFFCSAPKYYGEMQSLQLLFPNAVPQARPHHGREPAAPARAALYGRAAPLTCPAVKKSGRGSCRIFEGWWA